MPRRNRPPRWALVVIAVVGTFFGTAAAAQPSHHGPPSHADSHAPTTVPPTAPPTEPPSTVPPTTTPPTTAPPPTTEPTTTTTEAPPPPSTTEPPIQEPTTTTTEAPPPPSTTEPPIQEPTTTTTEAPTPTTVDGGGDGPGRAEVPPAPVVDDVTPTGGAAAGVGATADSTEQLVVLPSTPTPAENGTDDIALRNARWVSSDVRALVSPPAPGESDTRPLWLAVLFGLGAGIGLTATASVVVNNLHRVPATD